jgi:hypothetical protein
MYLRSVLVETTWLMAADIVFGSGSGSGSGSGFIV